MDILIKSFNRPFYLDRCLNSIHSFVSGDYRVSILDDGTPQKYLDKIQEKYPSVKIFKSENHSKKVQAIKENLENRKEINGFQIPTQLWYNAAKNASDYFIMTEDDVWFSREINTDELSKEVQEYNINLLKLGWLGSSKDEQWQEVKEINHAINAIKPKDLFLSHPLIMDWFFYNRLKFFSILYKLGKVDNQTKLRYWTLNSILMGLWKKEYWLYIWKDAKGKVDEKQQLRNAAVYYNRFGKENPNFTAQLKNEAMLTTFQSSATNSYHKYSSDFDVNIFNHIINEAWYNGNFDAMENFPNDFSMDYFIHFIKDKMNIEAFKDWVEQFKEQYRKQGCKVD